MEQSSGKKRRYSIASIYPQQITARLKARVNEANGKNKPGDLREIEDAFQYGEIETLDLFDRVLHCGYSLYFVRTMFRNSALAINEDIIPSLTENHLYAFAAIPGGVGVTAEDGRPSEILRLIIDHPEDSLLIASILRDREIVDPEKIREIIRDQRESSSAFSSGVL